MPVGLGQRFENFKKCHEDHPMQIFFGACNDLKSQLDKYFRKEKQVKRKANFEASKLFKEKPRASRAAKAASESMMPASA